MRVVVSTLCNRPDYTRQMVEALAGCHGAVDYTFMAFAEPGCPEVLEPVRRAEGRFKECVLRVNKERLYVRRNMYQALNAGFAMSDRVIVFEDDCIPSVDALRYFEWALEQYEDDCNVFSVAGYHRPQNTGSGEEFALAHQAQVHRRVWFHPWGWATWRRSWQLLAGDWALPGRSWDCHIRDLVRRRAYTEIYPAVPRVKNVGSEGGTSSRRLTPKQYADMHDNGHAWAGNWELPEVRLWVER